MPTQQDNRTLEQFQADYERGKQQQSEVISRLKECWVCEDLSWWDEWWKKTIDSDYVWDCRIMMNDWKWRYLEIKNNRNKYLNIYRKKYQYDRALKNFVGLLMVAKDYYTYISRWTMPNRIIKEPKSWKEVCVYENVEWLPISKIYLLFE